jgi:hypothetical protein
MAYELKEIVNFMQIYHNLESKAMDFLSISAGALKNKSYKIKSAQTTLNALKEYKKLPLELRKELEKDKMAQVSKIIELEKAAKKVIEEELAE